MNLDDCNGCGGGPCHGDCKKFRTPQTTPREEWAEEFADRWGGTVWVADPYVLSGVRSVSIEIKDFIRETRTAAYKEGLQAALEAVAGLKQHQPTDFTNNGLDIARWNALLELARTTIIACLQD